jgi:hypothetical protein
MKRFSFLHNRIFEVSPAADSLNRLMIHPPSGPPEHLPAPSAGGLTPPGSAGNFGFARTHFRPRTIS